MSEQLHMTSEVPDKSETDIYTSPDGKSILEASQFKEPTAESKLGKSIVGAAERINSLLVSGIEFRDELKGKAEASTEFVKEKLKAFGGSALLVCDTVIGFSVLGAEATGNGLHSLQEKATEAGINFKNEASASYKDFKDTIDFAKNDIKENVKAKASVVNGMVNEKVETINSFKNEKVNEVREFFHQKRVEAEYRKELRIEKRNQRKAEIKQFFETTRDKVETSAKITKEKAIAIGETAIAFSIVGADIVNQTAINVHEKAKENNEKLKVSVTEKVMQTRETFKQKQTAAETRVLARKKAINDFTKRAQAAGTAARVAARESWKNSKTEDVSA